ncbi:reticulon-like protein B2 [Trifolium medium]|uniref:Reticulon-like protein B2 n=1 Tax=Trifolium medium TaxID=97028 RepID=A0A392NC21_9FABA|nr:reticulon-like protein B2 [Trifolium medium]
MGFMHSQESSGSWHLRSCMEFVIGCCSHLGRYYQQHYMVRDEWVEVEDETWEEAGVGQKQPNLINATNKVKKGF